MRKGNLRTLFLVLTILFVGSGFAQGVKGQNNKPEDKEVIQDLLAEVRMLRQALQTLHRMNLDSYRSQLMALRRVPIQLREPQSGSKTKPNVGESYFGYARLRRAPRREARQRRAYLNRFAVFF